MASFYDLARALDAVAQYFDRAAESVRRTTAAVKAERARQAAAAAAAQDVELADQLDRGQMPKTEAALSRRLRIR